MKFANINANSHGRRPEYEKLGSPILINLGDLIQLMSVDYLYRYMGIKEDAVVKLNNYELQTYSGELMLLPINFMVGWPPMPSGALFSPDIIPVFLGASFPEYLPDKTIEWLKRWEPIGCRDEATYQYLLEKKVDAYLAGCLTITFPKRAAPKGNKVFLIDIPDKLNQFIPKEFLERAIYKKNQFVGHYDQAFSIPQALLAKQAYEDLAKEAALVVTTRHHVASPCIAMGIPVIVCAGELISSTFSWINKYVPIYREENYGEINWTPSSSLISKEQKEHILNTAANYLWSRFYQYEHRCCSEALTRYYTDRPSLVTLKRGDAISLIAKNKINSYCGKKFRYTLWGAIRRSQLVYEAIQAQCSSAELVAVYDTFKSGTFLDHKIQNPEEIKNCDEGICHIVCSFGAYGPAKKLFNENNIKNYCFLEVEYQKIFTGHEDFFDTNIIC